MKAKERFIGISILAFSLLIVPFVHGEMKGDEEYGPRICLECHRAQPLTLMGEWEQVAMKSATIQMKIGDRHEVVTFDKGSIKISNSTVKGDTEKMLRGIKKGDEVAVRYVEKDGVKNAVAISIKPPVKVPAGERIKPADLERLVAKGPDKGRYLLVDSRPAQSFREGAIPTAVNLPFSEFSGKASLLPKDKKRLVVFYGDNAMSRMGTESMKLAKAMGYRSVKVLAEGLDGWLARNSGVITAEGLKEVYVDTPHLLLDARPGDEAVNDFIKGAVAFADTDGVKSLPKKDLKAPIIVYDGDGKGNAGRVAAQIVKSGQVNVKILSGGMDAAKKAQIPIESGRPGSAISYTPKPEPGSFPMDEFITIIDALPPDTLIIDVRNGNELMDGTIKGAVNIPAQDFFRRSAEIPRERRVIAYCNTGARAEMAYHILKAKGYSNIFFLKAHVDFDDGKPDIY